MRSVMLMKSSELISVVMGVCYRRTETNLLKRAVESILQQTHQNLELLICENGSTQEAKNLLKQFACQDSRIRMIDGSGTSMLSEKLNRCIKAAKGNYIARQDDDDESRLDRLETQIAFLDNNPQYAFVGCNVNIEQDGVILGVRKLPFAPTVRNFLFVQPFIHPSLMFRRECLEKIKYYSESKYCYGCEDYDLLLHLYQCGFQGANLQQPYFTYHIPSKGLSNRTFLMRCNEVVVRWKRFKALGMLPQSIPYVIKPIMVGLIPINLLHKLKSMHCMTRVQKENKNE